jgi:hypothetical protein
LLAMGWGVPPAWVADAAGAEVWALFVVARFNPFLPRVITDCLGVLRSLQDGYQRATGPNRRQARLWTMIGRALDLDFAAAVGMVVWMPAHGATHTIGVARDSTGSTLTPTRWRANRLADLLAKSAAGVARLPAKIRKQVADAGKLYKYHCAKLGVATSRANSHRITTVDEQGVERIQVVRDSTAERPNWKLRPRKLSGAAKKCQPDSEGFARVPISLPLHAASGEPESSRGRHCRKRASSSVQNPTAAKRAKINAVQALRQDAQDESQLARWIAAYTARPSTAQDAEERMAALRARVRSKAQQWRQDMDC